MLILLVGLIVFLGIHLVPMSREIRTGVVARFGEGAYKAIFSILSAIGLALIVYGYAKLQGAPGKNPDLWTPPTFTRHLALALMLPAMILLVAAYVPSTIRAIVGHPMLAAIKIWAFAHLLANGDLGSVLLFGSFLVYAVADRISVKRRSDGSGQGPLGARRGSVLGDVVAVSVGLALYVALLGGLHGSLFGVDPVPGWTLCSPFEKYVPGLAGAICPPR